VISSVCLSLTHILPVAAALNDLLLMIQPYQEKCGGSHDYNLLGKLVFSGSLRVQIPKVSDLVAHWDSLSRYRGALIEMC